MKGKHFFSKLVLFRKQRSSRGQGGVHRQCRVSEMLKKNNRFDELNASSFIILSCTHGGTIHETYFYHHVIYDSFDSYRGIGGGPAPIWGPSKTCFCCDFCISSICARSVSKMTGAKRIMLLVKKIQEEAQTNLYNELTPTTEASATVSVKLRTGSGNISVRPQRRSASVSSGSSS